jgi:Fe2+ or Zn2+ uptake regulation protein
LTGRASDAGGARAVVVGAGVVGAGVVGAVVVGAVVVGAVVVAGGSGRPLAGLMGQTYKLAMEPAAVMRLLADHGVQPSAQRVAVASWVLASRDHPSADQVFAVVRERLPVLARATVYNTLHLLVRKGLLRQLVIAEGRVVFDPVLDPHHHFVDDETGAISDVPFAAVAVEQRGDIPGVDVRELQVVVRGRRRT